VLFIGELEITGDKDEHVSVDTIRDQGRKGTLKVFFFVEKYSQGIFTFTRFL
jgi:hypothetical protein